MKLRVEVKPAEVFAAAYAVFDTESRSFTKTRLVVGPDPKAANIKMDASYADFERFVTDRQLARGAGGSRTRVVRDVEDILSGMICDENRKFSGMVANFELSNIQEFLAGSLKSPVQENGYSLEPTDYVVEITLDRVSAEDLAAAAPPPAIVEENKDPEADIPVIAVSFQISPVSGVPVTKLRPDTAVAVKPDDPSHYLSHFGMPPEEDAEIEAQFIGCSDLDKPEVTVLVRLKPGLNGRATLPKDARVKMISKYKDHPVETKKSSSGSSGIIAAVVVVIIIFVVILFLALAS